jgi:hypothetical protein
VCCRVMTDPTGAVEMAELGSFVIGGVVLILVCCADVCHGVPLSSVCIIMCVTLYHQAVVTESVLSRCEASVTSPCWPLP